MKKKSNFLLILLVLLVISIIGAWTIYNVYYAPNARISATYMEVYQELDPNEISVFSFESVNHKLVLKTTDEDKIKITYFQKENNNNSYVITNRGVTLKLIERVEDLNNTFYQSKRSIDTITVLLPKGYEFSLTNKTTSGTLMAEEVQLNSLVTVSVSGGITLSKCDIKAVNLNTNYGPVGISESEIGRLIVSDVSGDVRIRINDSINDYGLNLKTSFGTLLINGHKPVIVEEEVEKEVNEMQVDKTDGKYMEVIATRSYIVIDTNEPAEPAPTEQTQEPTEEKEEKPA